MKAGGGGVALRRRVTQALELGSPVFSRGLVMAVCCMLGCAAEPRVLRTVHGMVVEGPVISGEAYEAMLSASLQREAAARTPLPPEQAKLLALEQLPSATSLWGDVALEAELGKAYYLLGRKLEVQDSELAGHAFLRASQHWPSVAPELTERSLAYAGQGAIAMARRLAARAVELRRQGLSQTEVPRAVARLALEDAILREQPELAFSAATTARIALDEVCARAELLGHAAAMVLAGEPVCKEPPDLQQCTQAGCAKITWLQRLLQLARIDAGGGRALWLAYKDAIARVEQALEHDALTEAIEVELVLRGVLSAGEAGANARAEVQLRRGALHVSDVKGLDPRHQRLAQLRSETSDPRIQTLAEVDPLAAWLFRADAKQLARALERFPLDPMLLVEAVTAAPRESAARNKLCSRLRSVALSQRERTLCDKP
jgi:hypothetical protein